MHRPPALAIVSFRSGAGKTTILEGIIRILTKTGYRVCAIKHSAHSEIRDAGKDTWKYREAGAAASALLQPSGYLEVCSKSADLHLAIDVISRLNPDIVLCEGFKDSDLPKIAIVESSELDQGVRLQGVVAFVLKEDVAPANGVIRLPFDPSAVSAFIESRFL
ncbi:MAG: molybdopterin-guanine dinucleotide biosynthesis protein B, partial [Candidatus Methanosuratincola sp.]|nr:molybdopterin-guanine dinucleotide biosynthesis protein B [Candidatus Methanosuratincola sp.]